jgi:hypothetical protein
MGSGSVTLLKFSKGEYLIPLYVLIGWIELNLAHARDGLTS